MTNGFLTFIILIIGVSLLCYHLIRVAQSVVDSTNDDRETIHRVFALLCLPFVLEFSIIESPSGYDNFDLSDLVVALALTGWITLYAVAFEITFRTTKIIEVSEDREGWILAGFLTFIAIFDLWRLYEIIIVREHFWVLLFPIIIVGFVVYHILENSVSQPQSTVSSPLPAPPPQPKFIIDNEDDHPIKPDPASVFEKRNRD